MIKRVVTTKERLEIHRLTRTMTNSEISDYLDIPLKVVRYVVSRLPSLNKKGYGSVINPSLINSVRELMSWYSNSEIAKKLNVSLGTVRRILSNYHLQRKPEEESAIRSRLRKELIITERRRVLFGYDQKTKIKVFTNRERNVVRNNLRRCRYKVIRNDMTVYFTSNTRRNEVFEERGKKVGLSFAPLPLPL